MRICGIGLTGNDAIACILHLEGQQFQFAFAKLMGGYGLNKVAIRERMPIQWPTLRTG